MSSHFGFQQTLFEFCSIISNLLHYTAERQTQVEILVLKIRMHNTSHQTSRDAIHFHPRETQLASKWYYGGR